MVTTSSSTHAAILYSVVTGPALENMKKMAEEGQQFDFIFLDADKSEYIDYLTVSPSTLATT